MSINKTDLLPLGRGGGVYKIEVDDLTDHQKSTFVELDGDTMQGPLKLLSPVSNDDGTNKLYVDTEVQKVVDQLNDVVDQRSEGIYEYKAPGFNGSSPRPPGNGEFYFVRSLNNDFTPLYESADQIYISHKTATGETNNLHDIKVGEYMQFNIAATPNSVTYIVESITDSGSYTIFGVDFNRKSSDAVQKPADGEQMRLQSYHIDGIDVDELNVALDERYVSTAGDIVSGSIALGDTTIRSGGGLRVLADGPNGVLRALSYIESGYVDKSSDTESGIKLNAIGDQIIQRPLTDNSDTRVFDIRYGSTNTLSININGSILSTNKFETASTQDTDGPQTLVTKDYADNLITIIPSPWEESGGNIYPIDIRNIVGIGTKSPTEHLHVEGNAKFTGYVQFSVDDLPHLSSARTTTYTPSYPDGNTGTNTSSNTPTSPWEEGSGNIYPSDLRNQVGIGTNSPSEMLDVDGNGFFSGYIQYDMGALTLLP